MNLISLCFLAVTAISVAGCGDEVSDAGAGATVARPQPVSIEATKQAEKAADARRPLNDNSLTEIVRSALLSESSIDPRKIDIENRDGNIALYGTVNTPEQRERIERIVMSVGGVRSVTNNLAITDS